MDEKHIYFVQCDKFVKIGITSDVKGRFRQLQLSNPQRLNLLGVVIGNDFDELNIHSMFMQYRMHGEWFNLNNEIIEYINKHKVALSFNEKEKGV